MLNPSPSLSTLDVGGPRPCVVADDALVDPGALVDLAAAHQASFGRAAGSAYPGLELPLPESVVERFCANYLAHAAALHGVTEVLRAQGRLSLVTLQPHELAAIQRVCHRDRLFAQPGECAIAAVLYLYADEALGGTSFFRPRQDAARTEALMRALARDDAAAAELLAGQGPGYLTRSSPHFELTATVPPKWNRLIWYDGSQFHGSHIEHPGRLSPDPAHGRLTLNLFLHGRCEGS